MIQKGTILKVIDNSGAKKAACIHMYQGYRRRYAKIGDVVKVAIKKVRKKDQDSLKIKKGDMSKAVVVSTKSLFKTFDGELKKSDSNCVVLISDQNKYLGTRVFSSLDNSLRYTKYLRLLSLAGGVIY
ncbi:MAG TPA: 50S ribosomal protein L14 [Chitinophagales bacterium]|nr:50S ribosomal protein L14 [Chitinophagales bacterium]